MTSSPVRRLGLRVAQVPVAHVAVRGIQVKVGARAVVDHLRASLLRPVFQLAWKETKASFAEFPPTPFHSLI